MMKEEFMRNISTKKLVLSGLFMALALLLPFVTGQIPSIGNKLLPMHIPVLLCGFICGWPYGVLVGFVAPLLRSLLFGMPPLFPIAISMAFELATYGLVAGLMYKMLPKKQLHIYVALIVSMIAGRIVWGIASAVLFGIAGMPFTFQIFAVGAFVNAIPGIIAQIILIPPIIMITKRAGYMQNDI